MKTPDFKNLPGIKVLFSSKKEQKDETCCSVTGKKKDPSACCNGPQCKK